MKTNYLAVKAAGHAIHRMTNQGLDCAAVRAGMDRIVSDDDWYPAWTTLAQEFRSLGEESLAAGHRVSAGQLLTKAALAYHFAQYLHFGNREEKAAAARDAVDCYARALPLQAMPGRRIQVPFGSDALPAVVRVPVTANGKAPLSLLVCGSDSAKEEHFAVEMQFLQRGFATVSFDGPGQGEVAAREPMRPDYHRAVSAVIDAVSLVPGIDAARIGVVGFGFGGMLAVSGACADARIRACVSMSGYFDMGVMNWGDPVRAWRFAHLVGVDSIEEAKRHAAHYTLEHCIADLACPLLVMHGGSDAGIPAAAAARIAERAGNDAQNDAQFVAIPEGIHCFHNVPWKAQPLMCDWLQRSLA